MPGGLVRAAESILTSQVNWQKAFRSRVGRSVTHARKGLKRRQYGHTHPRQEAARKGGGAVALWPGIVQFAPQVTLVIDTSGSMS